MLAEHLRKSLSVSSLELAEYTFILSDLYNTIIFVAFVDVVCGRVEYTIIVM